MCYPHEAREEPPSVEVGPDEPAFRPVFDIHRAPDASRIAHRRVDFVEQCGRQDHVRVDEDEYVPVRMARTDVSGVGNTLHRFVDHRRALAPGDCGGLVLAVVVDDDYFDLDIRERA